MSSVQDSITTKQTLATLYARIHNCHICTKMDREKAMRREDAVTLETDTFLISQALAETQLRKSGVNFFNLQGQLGTTGRKLEPFLNQFGRTVYPYKEVELPSGFTIPKRDDRLQSVYNTDITQCFPGKNRTGEADRRPNTREIRNCFGQSFIEEELKIIRPKLLLLMGSVSREAFYEHFQARSSANTLAEDLDTIVRNSELPTAQVSGYRISFLPIPHPAARDGSFNQLLRNQSLIGIVRQTLRLAT